MKRILKKNICAIIMSALNMDDITKIPHFKKEELIKIFDACVNRTLGEVDKNNVFAKTIARPKITGIAGDVIEQSVLGYSANSKQLPDLNVDGIKTELKTTGIKYSGNDNYAYEAKEPMSITAVSPNKITKEQFENSNFWHKLENMLIVYYLYNASRPVPASKYAEFPIKGYEFHQFNNEDKKILQKDWETVRNFIDDLQKKYQKPEEYYPRLSSELRKQLLMIDTAPKWPNNPRFRLKRSVVTTMVQEYFGKDFEKLPEQYLTYGDIDRKCHELSKKYSGKTISELADIFNIKDNLENKAIGEKVIVRMFDGLSKKMNNIELFSKIGLIGKTVVVTNKGSRTEDMKLFSIDFDEVCQPDSSFEGSAFYDYFANHQMLCIVFEEPSMAASLYENKFCGFKRISFSDDFIFRNVRPVWEKIRKLILQNELRDIPRFNKDGKPLINKTGTTSSAPNFPKSRQWTVFVRGGGKDSTVKTEEVNGIKMYKQFLWLKGSFVVEELSKALYL